MQGLSDFLNRVCITAVFTLKKINSRSDTFIFLFVCSELLTLCDQSQNLKSTADMLCLLPMQGGMFTVVSCLLVC